MDVVWAWWKTVASFEHVYSTQQYPTVPNPNNIWCVLLLVVCLHPFILWKARVGTPKSLSQFLLHPVDCRHLAGELRLLKGCSSNKRYCIEGAEIVKYFFFCAHASKCTHPTLLIFWSQQSSMQSKGSWHILTIEVFSIWIQILPIQLNLWVECPDLPADESHPWGLWPWSPSHQQIWGLKWLIMIDNDW